MAAQGNLKKAVPEKKKHLSGNGNQGVSSEISQASAHSPVDGDGEVLLSERQRILRIMDEIVDEFDSPDADKNIQKVLKNLKDPEFVKKYEEEMQKTEEAVRKRTRKCCVSSISLSKIINI